MSQMIPYYLVENTLELIDFYKEVFTDVELIDILMLDDVEGMTHHTGKVGHADVKICGNSIFFSDKTDQEIIIGNNVHFTMALSDEKALIHAFELLSKDGIVYHTIKELFWCDLACFVRDKYGLVWSLYVGLKEL